MVRSTKRKSSVVASNLTAKKGKEQSKVPEGKDAFQAIDENDDFFKRTLKSLGYIFSDEVKFYNSDADQIMLQRKLLFSLKSHKDYPKVLDDFVEGFESYISENDGFISCLLPVTNEGCDVLRTKNAFRDSVSKFLIGIDILQPKIINCLLEKLPVLSADDDTIRPCFRGQEIDLPRLIVNQFRWIDRIVEGKDLVTKIFEVVSVSELPVQREIIACMPEVVDDSLHPDVCQRFKELLIHNSQLTSAVIEAFSNLNLPGTLLTEIRQAVLEILDSANLEDCPLAVKFILQSTNDDDCVEVIRELRSRLDFGTCHIFGKPEFTSTISEKQEEDKEHELMILDIIRLSIRFQKSVAAGWIKTIEGITDALNMKIIDFYAMVVMHGINAKRKTVEALLRQKVKSDVLTTELVEKAFFSYGQVFIDMHKDVLCIADSLLRSPEIVISNYGSVIYEQAFVNLDTYCQQEVVAALITHVGSGLEIEIESAFDVLSNLVDSHPDKMAPFTIFLKGILDYMDNLSTSQIRRLFTMVSSILVQSSSNDAIFEDDMYILIRKHLSSSSVKYKRTGIIGAVMIVASMARKREERDNDESIDFSSSQAVDVLSSGSLKEVTSLLEMANTCIKKDPEAAALYYDELSSVVGTGNLDSRVVHWIAENIVSFFQDEFIVNLDSFEKGKNVELLYDLDGSDGGIALNLFQLLLKDQASSRQASSSSSSGRVSSSVLYMNSLFRLIATCEKVQQKGSLEGIDALLGCPLVLFAMEALEKLNLLSSNDKELMCKTLFFAINWFREVVNAFSTQDDPEAKGKIFCRLETIAELAEMLNKCLSDYSFTTPPQAIFDNEETASLKAPKPVDLKKGKRKKNGKRKEAETIDAEKPNETTADKETVNEKDEAPEERADEKSKPVGNFSWQQHRCFFRELDVAVFKVLQYGVISKNVLDTEMHTKETEVLSIKPSSLQFLLEDLESKAAYALPSTTAVRKSLLKRKTNKDIGFSHLSRIRREAFAELMINLVPSLCEHLEAINSHFQEVNDKSDIIVDELNIDQVMSNNFQMILSCICRLFSWEKLKTPSCRSLLKRALKNVASRIKPVDDHNAEAQALLRETVHYFEKLSSSANGLSTAVLILKIINTLRKYDETEDTRKTLAKIADEFLRKEWPSDDQTSSLKYNEALAYLIKLHIDVSESPLELLGQYTDMLDQFLEDRRRNENLPALSKGTFPIFYKAVSEDLTTVMKEELSTEIEGATAENDQDETFRITHSCIRIFNALINIVKVMDTRPVLGSALKNGRLFLEAFLKHCMPILETTLKRKKDEVHSILKNLQQSTRCLHHFCGHLKVSQDVTLTNYVPSTKKCLETFVFRVKAMLAVNRCHSAFWLGNLKNRDIHGNEILSQSTIMGTADGEDTDSEMDEEQNAEVERETADVDEEEKDDDNESYSDSF